MSGHAFFALFDDPARWQVIASGQAEGRVLRTAGVDGAPGLRLDYDFRGGSGFVAIRRTIDFRLPDTFDIGFQLRGCGEANHFEFKVAAPGGADVWRHLCPEFNWPASWRDHRLCERDLPFAWGPAGGGAPSAVEAVEFVVVAGPGGKGWLELARPFLEDQTLRGPPLVSASSEQPGFACPCVLAGAPETGWRPASDDSHPWWRVDFGKPRRFGGVVIRWPDGLPPRSFAVELSDDADAWRTLYRARGARGSQTHIPAPKAESRHLRITFERADGAALQAVVFRPDAFSRTPNEFIHAVAADYPRGWFPRYWLREQSYWTTVGTPAGGCRALINEEGLVETGEASFSLEPFVLTPDRTFTWADVKTKCALSARGAPMPSVSWQAGGFTLEVRPWVVGRGDALTLRVRYRLTGSKAGAGMRLAVAVRPFQVTPPWQAFRSLGGRGPLFRIRCGEGRIEADGREVCAEPRPDSQGAASFEEGETTGALAGGAVQQPQQADDADGLASAAMIWGLRPGETALEVTVSVPLSRQAAALGNGTWAGALARWRRGLGAVRWRVPACAAPAFDCFRTAAGHILINRDGPALQPGPRRYTRSWIRDGVIMGSALARAGHPEALRAFLEWYAPFQREDGCVPCVVDRDGIDWLVEHDSHGQFLWGVREVFRAGVDGESLSRVFPRVRKAADYLVALRGERLTEHYRSGERAACYGLLPESASHEGYLAHPVHAYWDDFWGVRGLEAAAELAEAAGMAAEAERWRAEGGRFLADILRSLEQVISERKLAYIPGSVEWADFDPTATANAVAMLDFADALPQAPLRAMLESYLEGFRCKRDGRMPWNNYSAYEIRLVGAFVRLGMRDAANELLAFFLSDRRPREWNQWPEISWRDPRSPGHLGDLPHTWIAAEYMLSLASMVASEREASASMVLASGMPWAWVAAEGGFSVSGLPTRYGPLEFTVRAAGDDGVWVEVGASLALPPGGLTVAPPLPPGRRIVAVAVRQGSHAPLEAERASVKVTGLPFRAHLQLG